MGEEIELDNKQFEEACEMAGLSKSLSNYTNRISDQRVDQGIKSFQKNQGKKDFSDKERLESLENELKEMKENKANDDKKTLVITELKKQNLSDGFLKYIKTDNDPSQIAEAVTNFKNDLLEARQAEIDQKLKGNAPPVKGDPGEGGDSTLETYVENKNAGKVAGNPFNGKLDNKKGE